MVRSGISYWMEGYTVKYVSTLSIYVTGFVKRGLPHTSDLQASTIHNFRCVKAMGLQIVQFRGLT